jgi:hypothetical protein
MLISSLEILVNSSAPVGMGTSPYQVLAVTLTLFQSGRGADSAYYILIFPPSFENHRQLIEIARL